MLNRRTLLWSTAACGLTPLLDAAAPFWNRRPASQWTPDEITQLLTRSPWAKETNLDLEATQSGHVQLDGPSNDPARGAMSRTPVVVRWESAQPVRDTLQNSSLKGMEGRYAISVSNIPANAMNRKRHGEPAPEQQDLMAELQGAATLESPGHDPVGAGLVRRVPGSTSSYLFGFAEELLPLSADVREVTFILRTAYVSVKAKFEPKTMIYLGKLAV